jgi:hypothetical protein
MSLYEAGIHHVGAEHCYSRYLYVLDDKVRSAIQWVGRLEKVCTIVV